MTEFKIQLDDGFVQTLGQKQIEIYLEEFIQKIALRQAAKEVLSDLKSLNLENDPDWKASRSLAWQQERHKFLSII